MTIHASTLPATSRPGLRLIAGRAGGTSAWWEHRAQLRALVGGCPDHWWNPTARRTSACTCDRF